AELAVVGEHAGHGVALGERLGLGPRAGAHGRELDLGTDERAVVDGVELRGKARADDPDPQYGHWIGVCHARGALLTLNQSPTRWRAERTSFGRRDPTSSANAPSPAPATPDP